MESPSTEPNLLRAWDLASGASEAWDVLPAPATNAGFREHSDFVLAHPQAELLTLLVDDEPLPRSTGSPPGWVWSPGFYAGEVTAQLCGPDGTPIEHYLLDVSPDPAKSGRETFRAMLDEVWREDPLLVTGTEPATRRIGSLDDTQDPLIELARLRRHAPDFLRALQAIRARPRRALVRWRESAALHRVRRVDRRTASAAARNAELVEFLTTGTTTTTLSRTTLDVPRVEQTLDCAANRCLAFQVNGLARRTGSLLTRLQALVDGEAVSATKTPLVSRWPVRRAFLERLARELGRLRVQSPLREVSRPELSASGLNVISGDPLYATAWASGWKAMRTGLAGDPSDERMWISPSWEVFERWCFVRLAGLLRGARPDLRWERTGDRMGASWVGQGAEESVEFLLQPTFPSEHPTASGVFWSVSGQRIPDLVVRLRRGGEVTFLVLDAKYRCSRGAVLDAMTSAHVYQDSLRMADRRPEASLLLIPAGGGAPWLEDPPFHQQHRVGVVVFRADQAALPATLGHWLGQILAQLGAGGMG